MLDVQQFGSVVVRCERRVEGSRRSAAAVKLPRHQLPLASQGIGAVMVAIVRESPDLEQGS